MPGKKKVFNLDEVKRKTEEVLASQPAHQQIMTATAVASGTPSEKIEDMPETKPLPDFISQASAAYASIVATGKRSVIETVLRDDGKCDVSFVNKPEPELETLPPFPFERKASEKTEEPRVKKDWTAVIGNLRTLEDVQAKLMELTTNTRCPTRILKRLQLAAKALIEMKRSSKGDEKNIPAPKVKNMLRALKKAYCEAWATGAGATAATRIVDRIQEYCGKSLRVQYPEIDKACLAFICETGNEIVTPRCEAECLALEATLERL